MSDEQSYEKPAYEAIELACHTRVSWFDVRQLSATALKTIASKVVGSMSGRRELMAALEPNAQDHFDLAGDEAAWIDYIADCGDGWNASYSVAWLVGRDALLLNRDLSPTPQPPGIDCRVEAALSATPETMLLPAGRALILGGDEIYPTASRSGYDERLVGPLRSARFQQRPDAREIFAIPGNHDWYDGLTSFVRLFCQAPASRRWLGAWQTRQRRSYFAVALPRGWWLWGVDLALEDDFDPPQYDYFLSQAAKLSPGDQLILAVPTPVWLALERGSDDTAPQLGKLKLVMDAALASGATIPLIVTGDSHFYAHHRAGAGAVRRDYVVCGGGGAFTLGTVQVPASFATPDAGAAHETMLFPSRKESERLRWRVLGFPFVNPAFTATLVGLQLIALWLLRASEGRFVSGGGLGSSLREFGMTLAFSPGLLLWLLLVVGGFGVFGASGRRGDRPAWSALSLGVLHGAAQSAAALVLLMLAVRLRAGMPLPGRLLLYAAGLGAAYLALGLLFGLYLALSHRLLGMHNLEVYSAQAAESWKSFLRIRIDRDGATVHPVGLRRSRRRWVPAPSVKQDRVASGALLTRRKLRVPHDCLRVMDPAEPLAPQLIEPPFRCGMPRGAV